MDIERVEGVEGLPFVLGEADHDADFFAFALDALNFIAEESLANLAGKITLGEIEFKCEWLEGDG